MSDRLRGLLKIPTVAYNNSAGRLLAILKEGKSCGQVHTQAVGGAMHPSNASYDHVHEFLEVARAAFETFQDELSQDTGIPEGTKAIAANGLGQVHSRLAPINVNDTTEFLQAGEEATLELLASLMRQEPAIEDSEIDQLRASVDALKKEVESSDLPKSVREALQRSIRLTQNAMDEYVIRGARGFKDAFRQMLGDLAELYRNEHPPQENPPSWWKSLFSHAQLVDAIASRMLTYTPVLEASAAAALQLPG